MNGWGPPTFNGPGVDPATLTMPRGAAVPVVTEREDMPPPRPRLRQAPKPTLALRELILGALEDVGGQDYLTMQAHAQPVAFMGLLGKILPMQITGEGGGPMQVQTVDPAMLSTDALRELHAARQAMLAKESQGDDDAA